MMKQLSVALLVAIMGASESALAQPQGEGRPGARPGQAEGARGQDAAQPGRGDAAPGAPAMGNMEEAMAAWEAAMTPGPAHQFLSQFEGRWRTTTKMYMEGPGSEPMTSTGTARFRMVMDGRYLQQEFQGEMMGRPLRGMGMMGYDNIRRQYTVMWLDNMGTAMSHAAGGISPDAKVLTFFGTMDEPMTGEYGKMIRYRLTIQGPDRHLFEIQEAIYGEPFTVVAIQYERETGAGSGAAPGRDAGAAPGSGAPPRGGNDPDRPRR